MSAVKHLTTDHMALELDRLRAENRRLRRRLREQSRHAERMRRAYSAALLLAQLHVGYQPTSRKLARRFGLTQRQWENGMALLRLARVVNARQWAVHDMATIEAALQRAYDRALEEPEAFFARGPRHLRS